MIGFNGSVGRYPRRGQLVDFRARVVRVGEVDVKRRKRRKFPASTIGAGMAGFGLRVMLAEYFQPLARLLILAGFTVHWWQRIDQPPQPIRIRFLSPQWILGMQFARNSI